MTDAVAFHVLQQLIRKGVFDLDDIEAIAERLRDEDLDDDATAVTGAFFEAQVEPRGPEPVRLLLVANNPRPDGGNDEV
jgi:hypothetical protein